MQSLLGKLNFVSQCIHPGRIFVNRLLNWLREIPEKVPISIPDDFKLETYYIRLESVVTAHGYESLPRTISDWNRLPQHIVMSRSVETFKAAVCSIKYYLMKPVNSFNPFSNCHVQPLT